MFPSPFSLWIKAACTLSPLFLMDKTSHKVWAFWLPSTCTLWTWGLYYRSIHTVGISEFWAFKIHSSPRTSFLVPPGRPGLAAQGLIGTGVVPTGAVPNQFQKRPWHAHGTPSKEPFLNRFPRAGRPSDLKSFSAMVTSQDQLKKNLRKLVVSILLSKMCTARMQPTGTKPLGLHEHRRWVWVVPTWFPGCLWPGRRTAP